MKFCQTCLDLSNLFAAKTEQLLAATSDMAEVAGVDGKREVFEAARAKARRLRTECDVLKGNMKRHQSQHATPDISALHGICSTCDVLLKSLRDASGRLDNSILRMRSFACAGRAEAFNAALLESQSVNRECEALRAKAQHHKPEHQTN
jgi:hypothetical protein